MLLLYPSTAGDYQAGRPLDETFTAPSSHSSGSLGRGSDCSNQQRGNTCHFPRSRSADLLDFWILWSFLGPLPLLGHSAFGCVEALRWRSEPVRAMQPGSLRGVDLCGDFAGGLLEESMFFLKTA